jgi:hypothetical protein
MTPSVVNDRANFIFFLRVSFSPHVDDNQEAGVKTKNFIFSKLNGDQDGGPNTFLLWQVANKFFL